MINNKDTYTINEKDKVVINDTTKEKIKFRDIFRYSNGSTQIRLGTKKKNYILIEADKTLFSYNGRVEFRWIRRSPEDGSTVIQLAHMDTYITIKKDQK